MSEKRFTTKNIVCSNYCVWDNNDKPYGNDELVDLLNEQQATIKKLQDLCGKSNGENAKLRIENKRLQEEKGYWESKAMTLLLQVRRLTSRMTDREVEEFKKELEE